jgi:hypothetical protein
MFSTPHSTLLYMTFVLGGIAVLLYEINQFCMFTCDSILGDTYLFTIMGLMPLLALSCIGLLLSFIEWPRNLYLTAIDDLIELNPNSANRKNSHLRTILKWAHLTA